MTTLLFLRRFLFANTFVCAAASLPTETVAQTVRLPNQRTFSLNTSTVVPDQGAADLGAVLQAHDSLSQNNGGIPGSSGVPGNRTVSMSRGASGASVNVTVIDLDELDRMIRCQAENRPLKIQLPTSSEGGMKGTVARTKAGVKEQPAPYDYMLAMNHGEYAQICPKGNLEDARHYLQLADKSVRRGEWSSAEFFYRLAWQNLPESRRTQAVKDLLEARAEKIAASKDVAKKRVSTKAAQ